jgi:hypothetical protein
LKQIARIERREACILSICANLKQLPQGTVEMEEEVATSPEAHFHVSKSQNYPQNIPLFLQRHTRDLAIKVSAAYLLCGMVLILRNYDRALYPSFSTFSLLR